MSDQCTYARLFSGTLKKLYTITLINRYTYYIFRLSLGVARLSCLDGGEAYNERVITVGIGWVLLASATSGFSGYIKLAYCSSAKGAPVAQLVRASD